MELIINYDYSELVSYYRGVIYNQGKPLDFTIVKTTDMATKELIDIEVGFNKSVDNRQELVDKILNHFNKNFK